VTFLRNPDGVVERAYRTDTPDPERLRSDVSAVVDAY
jgi:protein SCO1/2